MAKKKVPAYQPRPKCTNRLALCALVAAAIGTGFAVKSYLTPTSLLVNGKYNDAEVAKLWKFFEAYEPTILNREEEAEMNAQISRNFSINPAQIEIKQVLERGWVIPYQKKEHCSESEATLAQRVEDLFSFINHPKIKIPKIDIRIPTSIGQIYANPRDDTFAVYVVRLTGSEYKVAANVYGIGIIEAKKTVYSSGHTGTRFGFRVGKNLKVEEVGHEAGNIFFGAEDRTKVEGLLTVSVECLHRAFVPYTRENIWRNIQQVNAHGNAGPEMVQRILEFNVKMEEAVVHALGVHYMQQNQHRFPLITPKDLQDDIDKHARDPRYSQLSPVLQSIKTDGMQKVIDDYVNGPIRISRKQD